MDDTLNILSIARNVKTLGPGNRIVIWVQGCPFNCKGCVTPEGIPMQINKQVSITDFANEIINDKTIDGITISGGEPFLQASKLIKLIELIKTRNNNLDYICYTGYELEDLKWEEAKILLSHLDLLIDGKYIEKLNNNLGLRGSSNQNFIFLTDILEKFKADFLNNPRALDFRIGKNMQTIGIPNKSINTNFQL